MCPREALKADEKGIIRVDEVRCNGCGICVEACEFGTMTMHPTDGIPLSCDLCDGDPECVKWCPESALDVTSAEIISQASRLNIFKKILEVSPL
jgi:Fe-S-cluster-containing dehydrogenase component